jgi:hypothetical protein
MLLDVLIPGLDGFEVGRLVKSHTVVGDALCRSLRSLQPVGPIVRHHHERLDGSGYPDGLSGDAIPLVAQIMAVVDQYDAVTRRRPYQDANGGVPGRGLREEHAALAASFLERQRAGGPAPVIQKRRSYFSLVWPARSDHGSYRIPNQAAPQRPR